MTETGIVAVVGVVASVVSALGTTWLTNSSQRRRDDDTRRATLEADARVLFTAMILTAREWRSETVKVARRVAYTENSDLFDSAYDDAVAASDFALRDHDFLKKITEARLYLADGALSQALDDLGSLRNAWWHEVVFPLTESDFPIISDVRERTDLVNEFIDRLDSAIDGLADAARAELGNRARAE